MWKSIAAWLLWLLGAGLLWLFENNTATRILLFMSVLMPPVCIFWARAAIPRLRCTLSAPRRCAKGAEAVCTINLHSTLGAVHVSGVLCCRNLLTGERSLLALHTSLRHGETTVSVSLCAAHCGMLELTLADLCVEGLFGLGRFRFSSDAQASVLVSPALSLPQIHFMENAAASLNSEQYSTNRPGSDPSETFSIREYQPGDPIRQIHWKLSQKTGQTMFRELGLPVTEQTLLLFDANLPEEAGVKPAVLDTMAQIYLSLSRALCVQNVSHTLAWINPQTRKLEWMEAQREAEFLALSERFLSSAGACYETNLIHSFKLLFPENAYAHTALVCAHVPPEWEMLSTGGRVVIFLPDEEPAPPGPVPVRFLPGMTEDLLNFVEL